MSGPNFGSGTSPFSNGAPGEFVISALVVVISISYVVG
jgi:hypothetical protein